MNQPRQGERMRRGMVVIIALAILTVVEYAAAIWMDTGSNLVLVIIAVVKAWLILDYFMHLFNAWRNADDGH